MLESRPYRSVLKEHYQTVIEPFFEKTKQREQLFFTISTSLLFVLSMFVFFRTQDSALMLCVKVILGFALWSFCFMCIHVNFHVNMLKCNLTLKQRIFPFYHHYVDVFLYQKHKENYNGAHLDAIAFIIIPAILIDNVIGSVMFLCALVDVFTHRWYHTKTEYRKNDFNVVTFNLLTFLESVNIINTKEHVRVHHSHDVEHLEDVQGWLDVFWPVIGKTFNYLGEKLYILFKGFPHADFMIWGLIYSVFAVLWFVLGSKATHSFTQQVVVAWLVVLSLIFFSSLQNKKLLAARGKAEY
jgi:hypothetical protein